MRKNLLPLGLAVFIAGAYITSPVSAADSAMVWDYDHVATEPLDDWRFLAVRSAEAPLPTVDRSLLAVVSIPWQLERPRKMGYWLRDVTVPKRFTGRDVFLVLDSRGPTRVYFNGTLVGERKANAGQLRVAIPENLLAGERFEVILAVQHGDQSARVNKTRLLAEPHGFSAFVTRRGNILRSIPIPVADGSNVPWRIKVTESEGAEQVGFDDSTWELGKKDFKWKGDSVHCWFRSKIVVPKEIGGLPTAGKRLNIRIRFDDAGSIFLNGKKLAVAPSPPDTTSFAVPQELTPGQEVFVALRILNKWGSGGLNSLEWRFAELDAAERGIHRFNAQMIAVDRVLRMHDHPNPVWLETLNASLDLLEEGRQNIEVLPEKINQALSVLEKAKALMAESPILLLEPYLQDVRQDRVTVMWETSSPVNSYVEYGEKKLQNKAEGISHAGTIQEVVLTGLKADTSYRYRAVSGNYRTETFTVHTAPDKKRPFTFLVWGDNRSDPDICEKVSLQMADAQAEFVLNVGDVVGRGSRWHEWTEHYLIPVRHWSHKWPSYVSIGNHEYGGSVQYGVVPAFEQYLAHPTIVPGSNEYWYSFDYSNAHFLFIDGNRFAEKREGKKVNDWTIDPTDPQFIWIEEDLKKAAGKSDWIFAFIHEPPFSEGWSGGYYDGEPPLRNSLVPLLERYGVDILFAGHTHDYERGLPHPPYDPTTNTGNNTVYIITGGGGSSLDNHKYHEWDQIDIPDHPAVADSDEPDEGEYYKYHYCWLGVDDDTVTFEAREVLPDGRDGGVFDRFQLKK